MALSSDNLRRQEQVRAGIQVIYPQLTPEVMERHPRYPRTETLLATYLSNCGLGYWTGGNQPEQARRNLARAIIFLKQVMGGAQVQTQIPTIKTEVNAASYETLSTQLTALIGLYRSETPSPPSPPPRLTTTTSTQTPPDITPQQAVIVESAPLTPPPRDEPPAIPVAPPAPETTLARTAPLLRVRVFDVEDQAALRNRAKWLTRPSYATQWSAMSRHPDDFPFSKTNVNSLLIAMDTLFTARDLAALQKGIEGVRTNINASLGSAHKAFIEFNKVVAVVNEEKQKYIGLAMTIIGGALSAVGGPLGGLVGKLLVEGVQHVVRIALDAAAVSAKATELGSGTAATKAAEFIQSKLQDKLFLKPESDTSLESLQTDIERQFNKFFDDIVDAIWHGINNVTGVVKVPGKPTPSEDVRSSAAMALLWKVFDKELKLIAGDDLQRAAHQHMLHLSDGVINSITAAFGLNRFKFAEKPDLQRFFELRYLARLVLDLAAQRKDPSDAVVNELEKLNIVGKWTQLVVFEPNGDQQRATIYAAGKIRYGKRHVSEREKLMLRTMCKYIDQRVQPMDVAFGRRRASEVDDAIKQYARDVTDYVKKMKSQGRESEVTAESLEALADYSGTTTRTWRS